MNNYSDLILKYQSGEMGISEREAFNRDFFTNTDLRKEFVFQEKLDKIMKESLFLEGIESDPNLIKAEILAQQDIDNYLDKGRIRNYNNPISIFEVETEVEIRKRIAKAEVEMVLAGIDDISETWVKNFLQRKHLLHEDRDAQRIAEYVRTSESFSETTIQMPAASTGRRISRKLVFQLAAAVFVLSLLLFKALTPTYSGESLYKSYYEPLETNSFQLRGSMDDVNNRLQQGVDLYLSKDYGKAELVFGNLRKMNKNLPEVLLFSGLNQMELNKYSAAITTFTDLLSREEQFVPEAQWYLGLCYIKTNEVSKARPLLASLSQTEGIYKKKAQLILKNLNQ